MHSRAARLLTGSLLALVPALAAAAPAGEPKPTEGPAEKVRKALDQTISLEVAEQPLNLALAQLREQTKLNILLDRTTLLMMGMDPEQVPVTLKQKDVKVRSALRNLVSPFHLNFVILGDTVLVTTEDMAVLRQMRQRVNVDFEGVPIGTALKQLSRETAANLTLDPRVEKEARTPITLQLEDVPLETALRVMAEVAGLKPVRLGNVLFVTTKANAAELRADAELVPSLQPRTPVEPGIMIGPGGVMPVPAVIGGGGGVPMAIPVPPAPPGGGTEATPGVKPEKGPGEGEKPGRTPDRP
jgi:type II secretory pathway component HofQ